MEKSNIYVLNNWNKYGDFESREECEHFLICCEAYGTSYEIAHESPIACYEDFGFVWTSCAESPSVRDCIEAITDYSSIYKNATCEGVALEIAAERYNDDKEYYDEFGETIEDIKKDLLSGNCDCAIIQVGNDVVYRVYC